jgi:hypothetical protein
MMFYWLRCSLGSSILLEILPYQFNSFWKQRIWIHCLLYHFSPDAYDELLQLQDTLQMLEFDPTAEDSWTFMWGNQKYSSQ